MIIGWHFFNSIKQNKEILTLSSNLSNSTKSDSVFQNSIALIKKFYDPRIIGGILLLYFLVRFFPLKFAPDYFHIYEMENFRTFIWSLFSVTLGFSGLILTLLLLSYNFYLKSTKRYTLEFIFDNIYLKLLFSGFFAIVLIQLLSFSLTNKDNRGDMISVMYLLFILTACYLILQLPLAIMGLKYSTSISKLDKVAKQIDYNDIDHLVNKSRNTEHYPIEQLEGNRLILLKDIGVAAIKDADWILPQKILGYVFKVFISSTEEECPIANLEESISINLWISKHFQRVAIKNSDTITMSVVMGNLLSIYDILINKKIYRSHIFYDLDDFARESMINVIQTKDFGEVREAWIKDYTEMMSDCLNSLQYSDESLPTEHFIFSSRLKSHEYPKQADHHRFWHYLINSQFDCLKDILQFAIEQKDNKTFRYYHWQIRNLIDKVSKGTSLTESQKRSYLNRLLYKIGTLNHIAFQNKLVDELEIISHLEIIYWAEKQWFELFRYAQYGQFEILKWLINSEGPYHHLLDEFFMLGRSIANDRSDITNAIKTEILDYIIASALKLYDRKGNSELLRYNLQYQLSWLFENFIVKSNKFDSIVEKYKERVSGAIAGFDHLNRPDF